jgi:hypothetical protein
MVLVPVPTIKWNLGSGSLVQFLKEKKKLRFQFWKSDPVPGNLI